MKRAFKKIYIDLMTKYLFFLFAVVVIAIGGFAALTVFADGVLVKYAQYVQEAGERHIVFDEDTMTLEFARQRADSERYEILNDNKVIFSEGPELGGETQYSAEEINNIIQAMYRFMPDKTYIAEYIPFTGANGDYYVLMIKTPKNAEIAKAKTGVNVPEYLRGTEIEKEISDNIRNILFAILFLLIVVIFFLNRVTTKKIIIPLRKLRQGLQKVDGGELDTRLDFKANEEFEWVRDAFNKMTKNLEETKKENERLTESKKQFILDLSHDLRTPITTIKGYSEALTNGMVEDEEQRLKYLEYINKKSTIMTQLINKLFDYSKLESGYNQLKLEKSDLANCFRNVIIQHFGEMEEKEFVINIEIPDRQIPMMCDVTEMERAVSNIISNQIKYNPPGTKVSYELIDAPDEIKLVLKDYGIGIKEDVLERIFDVMVRGDESRHGVSGTGLGLAITKKVVELHCGTIEVKSRERHGTTFEITFEKKADDFSEDI